MATLKLSWQFDASPERVFAALTDFANLAEFLSAVARVEMLTEGPVGVGTRFRETRLMGKHESTEEMEVRIFEPGKRVALGCHSCGCAFLSTFELSPADGGTRVVMTMDTRPVSIFSKIVSPVTGLLMKPLMKKCMEKDMADVRNRLQQGTE